MDSNLKVLIASDARGDAEMVRELLEGEFKQIAISFQKQYTSTDFDRYMPDILILAFNSLAKAQNYYLGLYRSNKSIHLHPHRTIVLCTKEEIKNAYQLCIEGTFDDYMLFWPTTNDMPQLRLAMSIHLAVRELKACSADSPSAEEFAIQARKLGPIETSLQQQMHHGKQHVDSIGDAVTQAKEHIDTVLNNFSMRRTQSVQCVSATLCK